MTIVLVVFGVMLFIVCIMSVGVLLGRKPIKGSCGGLSSLGLKENCDICGGNDDECEKEQQRQQEALSKEKAALAYDATASGNKRDK